MPVPLSWELCHTSVSMTVSQGTPLEHLALVVKRLALLALRDCNNPCSSCQAMPPGHCTKKQTETHPQCFCERGLFASYGAYPEGQASMHSERLRGMECRPRGGTPIFLCLATAHPAGSYGDQWSLHLWPHSTIY